MSFGSPEGTNLLGSVLAVGFQSPQLILILNLIDDNYHHDQKHQSVRSAFRLFTLSAHTLNALTIVIHW